VSVNATIESLIRDLIDNSYSDGEMKMPAMSEQTERAKEALLLRLAAALSQPSGEVGRLRRMGVLR